MSNLSTLTSGNEGSLGVSFIKANTYQTLTSTEVPVSRDEKRSERCLRLLSYNIQA